MRKSFTEIYGGIEAGGTKFVCAIGSGPKDIRERLQFATTTPAETIGKAGDFLKQCHSRQALTAIGIASFGPLDLNTKSPTYGYIINTPKAGWADVNMPGMIRDALDIPIVIDTDVNSAALAEQKWGAAQRLVSFIYLTVGTGIGGGGIVNGQLMHGLIHPEMGHIRLPHNSFLDPFPGSCPFHGDCWEGLASGASIEKRWGKRPQEIPADHPAWELEAGYLALGVTNLIYALSPQRIILGGGVMKNPGLLPAIRRKVGALLNGYLSSEAVIGRIDDYLVSPQLGDMSGVLGAIALARQFKKNNSQ
jgi:fructokinase